MSFIATTLKRRCLIPFLLGIATSRVFSQAADSPVVFDPTDAIKVSFVDAPSIGQTSSGNSNSRDTKWLKVEFHYSVTPIKGDYLDSVEFKIWIEGRDLYASDAPSDEGVAVGLTGSVTYINIAANKDVYGVFYVHPSTLSRYSTKQGSTDFDRKFNIHLEADVDGKPVDNIDKNKEKDPAWFQQLRAVSGLVYRQNQSPFINSDTNRYPAIQLSGSS